MEENNENEMKLDLKPQVDEIVENDVDLESFGKKKKKKTISFKDLEEKENKDNEEKSAPKVQCDDVDKDVDLESFGKKKKKKKILTIDLVEKDKDNEEKSEPKPRGNEETIDDLDLESFDKKKKKKKVVKIDEGLNETHDLDLDFGEKKKKQKKRVTVIDIDSESKIKPVVEEDENSNPWDQSDRDYTYDEILGRVYGIMKQKNPEMAVGEKKKFVIRPPQVVRAGTKKTAFVNFTDMANGLRRQPVHLNSFINAELGTVGTVDGSNQLILKGRFQQKHIENVIRRYIKEYVTCNTCKSPTTILEKADRIVFLKCEICQSKYSVQTIKTGFQAVTGKRAAMRAKE